MGVASQDAVTQGHPKFHDIDCTHAAHAYMLPKAAVACEIKEPFHVEKLCPLSETYS